MNERELRERITQHGKTLYDRGLTAGSSGNISVRAGDRMLITPTNCCLGRLDPDEISLLDANGDLIRGRKPSKETFLHQAYYRERTQESAIVHLHSTWSVAVSCLRDIEPDDVLPPITAYFVMRVGNLQLVPYYPPGDEQLAAAVADRARQCHAMLLANHGPVIGAADLDQAVYAMEELEETAKLYLHLRGMPTRFLDTSQVAQLKQRFDS